MSLRDRAAALVAGRGRTVLPTADYEADREAIRESLDVILDRIKEDAAWELMDADEPFALPAPMDTLRGQSRAAFYADPYAKRSALLTTAFAFGVGIDGPTVPEGDPAGDLLEEFWKDAHNQSAMFGTPKQNEHSNQLQVEGQLCLLVYKDKSPVQVRRLAPDFVVETIASPEDTGRPLYYRVEYPVREWDAEPGGFRAGNKTKRVYYPDILNRDSKEDEDPVKELIPPEELEEDVYLLNVPLNTLADGQPGLPESVASLRYLVLLKQITKDQGTISRATAALMNTMYIEGDADAVETLSSQLRPASRDGGEEGTHSVPPLPGAMNMMNESAKLEQSRASTNAPDARTNARLMKMAAGTGFGWSLHYLGDPENANLATATSMELPQLKTMEAYQALWVWIYRSLCDFVLWTAGVSDSQYDIPAPAIVQHPLGVLAAAVLDAFEAGRVTDRQASQLLMAAFGMDNLDLELGALEDDEGDEDEADPEVALALARLEGMDAQAARQAPAVPPVAGGEAPES